MVRPVTDGVNAAILEDEGHHLDGAAHAFLLAVADHGTGDDDLGDTRDAVPIGGEVVCAQFGLEFERVMHVATDRHPADHRRQGHRAGEHGGHRQGIDRPARLHLLLTGRCQRVLSGVTAWPVAVEDVATLIQQIADTVALTVGYRTIGLKMHAAIGTG